jgi:O-antigen biosynthesis protein
MPGEIPKTLFVAWGATGVAYYRCFLPSLVLGAEFVTTFGEPPNLQLSGGFGSRVLKVEDFYDYDVVVLQQPRGVGWLHLIRDLQAAGVTVLYEIDDYVQSARKTKSHELSEVYNEKLVEGFELTMRVCDGVICSTPYLARRYRAFNERTWVCQNGIDLKRYAYPRPPRDRVTIGWSGGIGHKASLARWEPAIRAVLRARPDVRFASVGHLFAAELLEEFGPERALPLPSSRLEVYPASMTLFDIAIAPSAENNLFRGKSDLRWLEASALSLPLVAHPDVYPEIEDGVTGVHARTPADVEAALLRLIDDAAERERIGATAHAHVAEHRSAEVTAQQWRAVFTEATAGARA